MGIFVKQEIDKKLFSLELFYKWTIKEPREFGGTWMQQRAGRFQIKVKSRARKLKCAGEEFSCVKVRGTYF
jgi:hypothetical protein